MSDLANRLRAAIDALGEGETYAERNLSNLAGEAADALDGDCPECLAGIESGDGHNEGCSHRVAAAALDRERLAALICEWNEGDTLHRPTEEEVRLADFILARLEADRGK
jgi:hypothetical protein